ncbi:MAG: bifunctional folylpolyglutamate synthase/dihydrofolate synthase, partial [Gammaproteobacteria bacterium]
SVPAAGVQPGTRRRPRRLRDWLRWQQGLNPLAIDLGLERTAAVARRLGGSKLPMPLIVVAGTNGKGSTAIILEQIYRAAGLSTGVFLSPPLLRFVETVRIDGRSASEAALIEAFERVDAARGDVALTAFEFQTLAASQAFRHLMRPSRRATDTAAGRKAGVDVAIMEVGMGGRRDAVNTFDADLALVTNVAPDHMQWLGADREAIGLEKAGVMRAGCPVVCGELSPPYSLIQEAARVGAVLFRAGADFHAEPDGRGWRWRHGETVLETLPSGGPRAGSSAQSAERVSAGVGSHGAPWLQNAASAMMAAHLLRQRLPVTPESVRTGLSAARLPGRQQHYAPSPARPERLVDVAHNPAAAAALAERVRSLSAHRKGARVHAVFSMLADKDIEAAVAPLAGLVDRWFVGGNPGRRGLRRDELAARVRAGLARAGAAEAGAVEAYRGVAPAYRAALASVGPGDAVVVWGSFHTVRQVMRVDGTASSPETRGDG